jgi:hypothetical protein
LLFSFLSPSFPTFLAFDFVALPYFGAMRTRAG